MILCNDKSIYTGITTDLKRRLREHKEGRGAQYTQSHKPVKYLHSEKYKSRSLALKREAEIKSWDKAKKIKLISRFT